MATREIEALLSELFNGIILLLLAELSVVLVNLFGQAFGGGGRRNCLNGEHGTTKNSVDSFNFGKRGSGLRCDRCFMQSDRGTVEAG